MPSSADDSEELWVIRWSFARDSVQMLSLKDHLEESIDHFQGATYSEYAVIQVGPAELLLPEVGEAKQAQENRGYLSARRRYESLAPIVARLREQAEREEQSGS